MVSRSGRWARTAAIVGAIALTIAACGSDDDDTAKGDGDVQTGPGVSGDVIKLGHLTDLTGPFGPVGKAYLEGANLYVASKNDAGGICGRDLELVVEDHGYDVQRAITGYRKMKDDVAAMNAILGGGMANALLPTLVKDEQLTSVLTWTGSLINGDNVFLPGPDYVAQVANGTSWAVKEYGIAEGDTIGFIGFTGEVGEGVLEGAKLVADEMGITIAENWIAPTDTDFTGQISSLKSAGAKFVVMITSAAQLGTILSTAAAASYDAQWMGASPGMFDASLLNGPAKDSLENNFQVASGQAPWAADTPAAENVRKLYEEKGSGVAPQFGILTGYGQVEVFGQILEKACEAGDLRREGILEAFRASDSIDTGGLLTTLDFTRGAGKSQSLETSILKPDSTVEGGLVERAAPFTSELAEAKL